MILAGGRLEPCVSATHVAHRVFAADLAEPPVGVVDLDRMQAVAGETVEQARVVAHQPDHQLASRGDAGVDDGLLPVLDLAAGGEHEIDLGVFLGPGIDDAGAL